MLLGSGQLRCKPIKPGQGPVAAICRTLAIASGNIPDSPAAAPPTIVLPSSPEALRLTDIAHILDLSSCPNSYRDCFWPHTLRTIAFSMQNSCFVQTSANQLRVKANRISWLADGKRPFNFLLKRWPCASVAGQKDCGLVVLLALPGKGPARRKPFC